MKKIALVAAVTTFACMSGIAFAADLGSLKDAPEYSYSPAKLWTGWYIGGHIGGARGDVEVSDTYDYNGDPFKKSSFGTSDFIGGVQLGYNIQRGSVVYGLEADFGYLGLNGDKTTYLPPEKADKYNDLHGTYSTSGGLYGDITGRLGYAKGNSLLYLKGGAAFLNAEMNSHYAGNNWCTFNSSSKCKNSQSTFDFSESETMLGWTIGAGFEYALSPSLTLKAEYQHFDFGTMSSAHDGQDGFRSDANCSAGWWCSKLSGKADADITVDAVKLGINYRLNGRDTLK